MRYNKLSQTSLSTSAEHLYAFRPTSGSLNNTNALISGSAVVSGVFTHVTMTNVQTSSGLPTHGSWWSTSVKDVFGNTTNVETGDIFQLRLHSSDALLPADCAVFAVVTSGSLTTSSYGVGLRLRNTSGTNVVDALSNTGAGWQITSPTQGTNSAQSGMLWLGPRTVATTELVGTAMIDGSGLPVTVNNTGIVPFSMTGFNVVLNTISWGVTWAAAVSGTNGSVVRFSPNLLLLKPASFPQP